MRGLSNAVCQGVEYAIEIVAQEYEREESALTTSSEGHRIRLVQRLLASERVDPASLEYDLDGHHHGLVALSADARPLLRQLAKETGGRFLAIIPSEGEVSAWIGSRDPINIEAVSAWLDADWPNAVKQWRVF